MELYSDTALGAVHGRAAPLPAPQIGCEIQDIKLNNADLITYITHQ